MKKSVFLCFLLLFFSLHVQLSPVVVAASKSSVADYTKCKSDPKAQGCENIESAEEATEDQVSGMELGFFDYFQMIFALLFIIALLYGVLHLVKKQTLTQNSNRLVKTLGGTSVGNGKSVQIVRVGERLLIMGVGDDVTLIKEIEDEEEKVKIIQQYEHISSLHMDKKAVTIKEFLRNRLPKTVETSNQKEHTFKETLHQQMNDMLQQRKNATTSVTEREENKHE
ncbi:MAG: flagellar biosynthetic protein FliO [Bacilli bacterium]